MALHPAELAADFVTNQGAALTLDPHHAGASGGDDQGGADGPEATGGSAKRARMAGAAGIAAAAMLFPPCFPFRE